MQTLEQLTAWLAVPWVHAVVAVAGGLVAATLWRVMSVTLLGRLVGRTATDLDDKALAALRQPIAVSMLLVGAWVAAHSLQLPGGLMFVVRGVLASLAVLVWATGLSRLADLALQLLSHLQDRSSVVRPRSMPVFRIASRAVVLGGAAYFLLLAWNIDVTGWLASAGIVGIAVGFAAKDTLANLFAGVFIIADTPYRLGDYLVLETGERGRVAEIGMRSTRLITRDDVEIIIPNAQMATVRIVNQSGGPEMPMRVACKVSVAYGCDVDVVRALMLEISALPPDVVRDDPRRSPQVRFRSFGDSGLNFELLVWVRDPAACGRTVDALNTAVYKRFAAEGIEIPYPKRDVYLHTVEGQGP